MKRNIKQRFIIVLLGVVAVLIVPGIINILFKTQAPFGFLTAEWSAGEALSFYGVITSAVIAIIGISLTIQSSREALKEDFRNNMLPFVVIDLLDTRTKTANLFSADVTEEQADPEINEYSESFLTNIYFVITKEKIEAKRFLSGHQKAIVENGGLRNERDVTGVVISAIEKYVYIPLLLENVGNGAAINLRIGLNRKLGNGGRKYIRPFSLRVGQSVNVSIYCDGIESRSQVLGEYEFEVFYNDIYGNQYRQAKTVQICIENGANYPSYKIENLMTQERITS